MTTGIKYCQPLRCWVPYNDVQFFFRKAVKGRHKKYCGRKLVFLNCVKNFNVRKKVSTKASDEATALFWKIGSLLLPRTSESLKTDSSKKFYNWKYMDCVEYTSSEIKETIPKGS